MYSSCHVFKVKITLHITFYMYLYITLQHLQNLYSLHHILPAGTRHVNASTIRWIPTNQNERAHAGSWRVCSP